jgi:hypothetical protein
MTFQIRNHEWRFYPLRKVKNFVPRCGCIIDINDLQKKTMKKYEIQGMMDGLKREIMEGLKIFLIERTPKSENVSHEIHDEDTRKMNKKWRNSNFGLKTNHVPKIDMRKF